MKLIYVIQTYKSTFRMQDHTKDFLYIMDNDWKRLEMYLPLCFVVCFHYTKLNAVYDAHTI